MNDLETLTKILMLDAGIVPVSTTLVNEDPVIVVKKMINNLPPDQRRRVTRKFRKLWRKAYKTTKELKHRKNDFKGKKPPMFEHRRRIYEVCRMLIRENENF